MMWPNCCCDEDPDCTNCETDTWYDEWEVVIPSFGASGSCENGCRAIAGTYSLPWDGSQHPTTGKCGWSDEFCVMADCSAFQYLRIRIAFVVAPKTEFGTENVFLSIAGDKFTDAGCTGTRSQSFLVYYSMTSDTPLACNTDKVLTYTNGGSDNGFCDFPTTLTVTPVIP